MSASPTYPGNRSNEPKSNDYPFRDLAILNQPAGGIEFVNTKDDEMVTVYYKDGSFVRMNKHSMDTLATKDKREHVMGESRTEVNGNVIQLYDKDVETITLGNSYKKVGDVDKWQKYQENIKNIIKKGLHQIKRLFEIKRTKVHNYIDQSQLQKKSGILAQTPSDQIESKVLVNTQPVIIKIGVKEEGNHEIPTFEQDTEEEYKDIKASDGWGEFTGWGTGNSPSSQDGIWDKEDVKDQLAQKRVDIQKQLLDNEKHLGQNKHREGGTTVDKISKDYVGIVGLSFNEMESFRKDPKGKLVPYGTKIDPFGNSIYTQYRESTLLEHVHVEDLPGGNYDLTVCQKYDLVVGSGGMNFKTTGPMEIYSPHIMIAAEQTNISSRGETTISGERVDLSGEIISLRPKKVTRELEDAKGNPIALDANQKEVTEPEQQVGVFGNLNVELNAIIAGGMHVEGEVTLHHITAPLEIQISDGCFEWGEQLPCTLDPANEDNCKIDPKHETPKSPVYADMLDGCEIGVVVSGLGIGGKVVSKKAANAIMVHQHYHYFKNIPLKLLRDEIELDVIVGDKEDKATIDCHSAVRAIGARNNFANKILAMPIQNSFSEETIVEKYNDKCQTDVDPAALKIDNTKWAYTSLIGDVLDDGENKLDTLPDGEGVKTSKYPDDDIFSRVAALEKQLEDKYKELENKLDSLTKNSTQK